MAKIVFEEFAKELKLIKVDVIFRGSGSHGDCSTRLFAITKSFMTVNEYWTSQYFKCWYTYFDIRKIYELKKLVSYYFEFE